MSHTQTKLRVGEKYTTDIFADRAGHAIARTVNPQAAGEDEANARRLVACWNACTVMPTKDIEELAEVGNGVMQLIVKASDAITARDELLEALESMLEIIEDHPCHTANEEFAESEGGDVAFVSHLGRVARAAIEKVKA